MSRSIRCNDATDSIFGWYIGIVQSVVGVDVGEAVMVNGQDTYPNTTAAIAATHSIFNVANTLLFLPFVPLFSRFLTWLVPVKEFSEKSHLTDLDIRMLDTPPMAIGTSAKRPARRSHFAAFVASRASPSTARWKSGSAGVEPPGLVMPRTPSAASASLRERSPPVVSEHYRAARDCLPIQPVGWATAAAGQ